MTAPRRRGRTVVAIGLLGFLIVTLGVIARRSVGRRLQDDLTGIERTRTQLSGDVIKLESEIRSASSRKQLAPLVQEKLGMRVPSDTQVIDIPFSEVPRAAR